MPRMNLGTLFFVLGILVGLAALISLGGLAPDGKAAMIVLVCYGFGFVLSGVPIARVVRVAA
jgi:hypothetical protein